MTESEQIVWSYIRLLKRRFMRENEGSHSHCGKQHASTPSNTQLQQDAQLSQRDRAAGCVIVLDKSGRLELRDNILRTYVYLQPCNRPKNLSNSVKKRKIRAIMAFKVIQGHRDRYQSKARMRLSISD